MRLPLASASVPYLAASGLAILVFWWGWRHAGHPVLSIGFGILAAIAALLFLSFVWFFRDPERRINSDPALVLAPGDGTVVKIHRTGRDQTVEMFLSITNVHLQRAPAAGLVRRVKFTRGSYLAAYDARAGRLNTRCETEFATAHGPIGLTQVAGVVARRVECWVKPGVKVAQGERIGIIHMGSQLRLRLPLRARLLVGPGDAVRGGITPIAKWR
jgi:phosphatidylserine decarboxylase